MDIKGFGLQIISSTESAKAANGPKEIKSDASNDRDANGKREDQGDSSQESLTEEHVQKALEYLQEHSGIKGNNLIVKRKIINNNYVLLIEDYLGKVVRRIPSEQIFILAKSSMSNDPTEEKGQLFHRAM